jgi:hypothetical protein
VNFSEYCRVSAKMRDIKIYARKLAYLRSTDKMMAALANEFGTERTLPARAWLQQCIDDRHKPASRRAA